MNTFDDPDGTFVVLTNADGQQSLWPAYVDAPPGWVVAFGEATREACLAHIRRGWPDPRPEVT